MNRQLALPGALVLSLDFELHWGVRDRHTPTSPYHANLLGARQVIPSLLELFEKTQIAATWATVGFLLARSRDELHAYSPTARPAYANRHLDPYAEPLGADENDDPLHYAPSLVRRILETPYQELGTHTFSHYYCGEPGQTADAFRADLAAACRIAAAWGAPVRSIVFPRNQRDAAYDVILLDHGIDVYRGNPLSWMWRFRNTRESDGRVQRLARLLDSYAGPPGSDLQRWDEVPQPSGLADVRATALLRPYAPRARSLERRRFERVVGRIREAARTGRICHLWWHPHNFGAHQQENLDVLRAVLRVAEEERARRGLLSLTMAGAADLARREAISLAGSTA
ncbi:MAG TPA: polysaccharide deacetylase family protein [Gemmatimonadaceae bacterium]|nr:polysaccharide deacetylase family protein [Gemmatimonadaceae bacterium]